MRITLSQKILAGFIACAIILGIVAFFSIRNSKKYMETQQWVSHTYEVLHELDQVLASVIEAETGARGFIIAGNESFLEPFNAARTAVYEHLDKAKKLTADNPMQRENISLLEKQIALRKKNLEDMVELRRIDFEKAKAFVSTTTGKELQDEIKRIIAKSRDIESNLLQERKAINDTEARNFNTIFIVLLLIITFVLIGVYFIITTNLRALKKAEQESAEKNWILSGSLELNQKTRGERLVEELAQGIIDQLCNYLNARIGAFYVFESGNLVLTGSHAFHFIENGKRTIKLGEGLVGQAAAEQKSIVFTDVPEDYIRINSGLGDASPRNIIVIPLVESGVLKGVIEMGTAKTFTVPDIQLLDMIAENVAIVISAAQSRTQLKELLEETQRQAEELETQQEELKLANEALYKKTEQLEKSETELKTQQEELQQSNEELEEKANLLEDQKEQLQGAQTDIETKVRELQVAGKYKSEFLANMSHELRTPLNSILILSRLLKENKYKTLGPKESEYARNIFNSGTDLLNMINEILDLSKVEAGRMELDIIETPFTEIKADMNAVFAEVAKNKSIAFSIELPADENSVIFTDKQRLGQIIKNLLSNAFKFTGKNGKVTLTIGKAPAGTIFKNNSLNDVSDIIAIAVTDTGIGIPEDKLDIVFEAFQQADGSTKRKYGGTGLGLSISRELAHALGGDLQVQSQEDTGSTFTLYLPLVFNTGLIRTTNREVAIKEKNIVPQQHNSPGRLTPEHNEVVIDDRYVIYENDKLILIMEDDLDFAKMLLELVHERKYKAIVATQGNTGLSYARHYKPDAILLDMKLPVMDGAEVLKHLKNDPAIRHIPVQIISAFDTRQESLELGAFDFLRKPVKQDDLKNAFAKLEDFVNRKLKKLLIVEDDEKQNRAIRELIGNGDVKCFSAYSGKEAFDMIGKDNYDCLIIDLGLPDMPGFDLLEKIKTDTKLNRIPIVIYTGRDLSKEENARLMKLANTVVLKTADSHERLLDETMLFLHRVESRLSKEKQNMIRKLHKTSEVLKNRTVLVVDDDIRNIYSLTNALEEEGIHCVVADNGVTAVKMVQENPAIELVLMDVMMPEMDGYEATKEIRADSKLKKLPIIALTAKAMKGDREKCLAAGMSDYIAKPINMDHLLSLMRVWLYV